MESHHLFDWLASAVLVCSVLHTFLPPWDFLNEFPRAQKYYKLVIYIIGYIAINGRSTVPYNKIISVNNPNGPNANMPAPPPEAK